MAMIMLWLLYIHTHNTYTHVSVHIAALSDVLFVLVLVAPLLPALQWLHTWKAAPLYALLLQHSFQFSRAFAYFVVIVVFFLWVNTKQQDHMPHSCCATFMPCHILHRYHKGLRALASVRRMEGMMMVSMHTHTPMRMEYKTYSNKGWRRNATHKCRSVGLMVDCTKRQCGMNGNAFNVAATA